jgi:hypothetical protein
MICVRSIAVSILQQGYEPAARMTIGDVPFDKRMTRSTLLVRNAYALRQNCSSAAVISWMMCFISG